MVDVTNIPRQELEWTLELEPSQPASEALSHWLVAQQTLAASTNLALVTIGADNDLGKNVANETSICQSFLSDPTKANQFLVYSFMSQSGVPAPRSNLARVVVNGEDLGVYANVESIGKPFFKRHFANAKGDLYEPQNGADFTTNTLRLGLTNRIEHKWGKDESLAHVEKLIWLL